MGQELHQWLVTGSMSSLQPESMSVIMHDWHTCAGLISAIWIKITLWEPELSMISAWALQSHGAQRSCMLEAMCSRLYLCSLASVLLTLRWKLAAIPPLTAAGPHLAHIQPGQHCEWWDAHNKDRVFWKAAYDTQACPSWEERAVTKPSTFASFVFIFVG